MKRTLSILWIAVLVSAALAFVLSPVKLDSDPLALLEGPAQSSEGITHIRSHIASQAKEVVILVKGGAEVEEYVSSFIEREQLGSVHRESSGSLQPMLAPFRQALLTPEQRAILSSPHAAEKVIAGIKKKLVSPLGSFYKRWIEADPLLLLPEYLLQLRIEDRTTDEGIMRVQLAPEVTGFSAQDRVVKKFEELSTIVTERFKGSGFRWTGYIRFAHDSARRLSNELQLIGIVSTLFVILAVYLSFQSVRPILLSMGSSIAGLLVATALSKLFYPELHLLTLTIGATLTGVTVDYSLLFFSHYYSSKKDGHAVMSKISLSLWVGALTSSLAFGALVLTGLEGLKQIAFFSVLSLLASFVTVLLLIPPLVPREGPGWSTYGMKFSERFQLSLKDSYADGKRRSLLVLLGLALATGVFFLKVNNDIRSFQAASPDLVKNQREILSAVQPTFSGAVLELSKFDDATYDELLATFNELVQKAYIRELPNWLLLPRSRERRLARDAYADFIELNKDRLRSELSVLGLKNELIERAVTADTDIPGVEDLARNLFGSVRVLPLPESLHHGEAERMLEARVHGSHVLVYPKIVSELFERQMQRSIMIMIVAYVVIVTSFILRYGFYLAVLTAIQVGAVTLCTLGTLGLLGVSIDFFSVLALVIVLGLCIDYGVFFLEDVDSFQAAATSVVTSTVTTIGTFAVLLFSSAPVMLSFGLTISLGVFFSMILAPLVAVRAK